MPNGAAKTAVAYGAKRVPGLRRLPVLKMLAAAEIALLAHQHFSLLDPGERRRIIQLVKQGRGRPSNLSPRDRSELQGLLAKMEPRLFVGTAADKISPVPLPKRVVRGPRRRA
jgi:hypothetical protein